MTVECAPESEIESVEIVTDEVNLEDDAAPVIEARATLAGGRKIPVFGFGKWTVTFDRRIERTDCPELEENSYQALHPEITVDDESRLTYARGASGLLEVCDQVVNVKLEVNEKSVTKAITVWGPTKVIASKWQVLSGDRQTTLGVVRLNCTELKYNYGGKIKTTADTYFASFATVLRSGIFSQTSYLRGLTVFVDNYSADKTYTVDLKARKANGKYAGYTPELSETSSRAVDCSCLARGSYKTAIGKGLVTEITLVDLGERTVEIPPSVSKIGGVDNAGQIVVRGGGHDITQAMKFTAADGGFQVELNEEAKVKVCASKGGVEVEEEISVRPELAADGDETPFEVRDGELVFTVKSIPGLRYQVLESSSLDPNGFTPAGQAQAATTTRRELSITPTGATRGFYKIQVSR